MNIPTVSVSEAVSALEKMFVNAITKKLSMAQVPAVFLWGPAGVGKSQGVYELADRIEEATEKKVTVTDVRLLLFDPTDVRGIPYADTEKLCAVWLKPKIFEMDPSPDRVNILFLDELSAAPQSIQAAAYQLTLDRKAGEHRLPDNCIVIAAGNRTTDQGVSHKMPKPLCNRLIHLNVEADFVSWRTWAVRSDVDPRVVGFLSFSCDRLSEAPSAAALAFPSPRTWEFVSRLLKLTGAEPEEIHTLIAGSVGIDAAIEFETWCKLYHSLPDIDGILQGKIVPYPRSHDLLYALVSSLTSVVGKEAKTISVDTLENVCRYAKNFPSDFAMAFFNDLKNIDELKFKLIKCPSAKEWILRHKSCI